MEPNNKYRRVFKENLDALISKYLKHIINNNFNSRTKKKNSSTKREEDNSSDVHRGLQSLSEFPMSGTSEGIDNNQSIQRKTLRDLKAEQLAVLLESIQYLDARSVHLKVTLDKIDELLHE